MKDYFIRLFGYDRHANLQILETISAANHPQKPLQLMAHLLAAQQRWLQRCTSALASADSLWPNWTVEEMKPVVEKNYNAWVDFLQQQHESDWQRRISYKNTQGQSFNDQLADIVAHLINHGTHHRAQAGQHLKLAGAEKLPATDYIFYIRESAL